MYTSDFTHCEYYFNPKVTNSIASPPLQSTHTEWVQSSMNLMCWEEHHPPQCVDHILLWLHSSPSYTLQLWLLPTVTALDEKWSLPCSLLEPRSQFACRRTSQHMLQMTWLTSNTSICTWVVDKHLYLIHQTIWLALLSHVIYEPPIDSYTYTFNTR